MRRHNRPGDQAGPPAPPPEWEPELWIEEEVVEDEPRPRSGAPRRATPKPAAAAAEKRAGKPRRKVPKPVVEELSNELGTARAEKYSERLAEAAKAYERDRYRDAIKILKPLSERAPSSAAVRELYGLALYRIGRWSAAAKELEAFRLHSGEYDQHPTLADCYRALKRWRKVDDIWEDLRRASPSAELMAEGRIVMAGALADRGRLAEAIQLLESAKTNVKRPRDHHVRTWYALADLYERAGELPRARELFRRVVVADPELSDARDRLRSIG